MTWLAAVALAVVVAALGYVAVGYQHHLYREPEFRENKLSGRRRQVFGLGLAATTGIAALLALRPGHYDLGAAIVVAAFAFGLLALASTDFERKRIPNKLSYPLIVAAAALCWVWPDRSVADIWIGAAAAMGAAAGLYVLGVAFGKLVGVDATVFGVGDVKLMLLLGLLLGLPAVFTALVVGAILAGLPSIPLTIMGKGRTTFSYGPFLVAGGLLPLLWPDRFV